MAHLEPNSASNHVIPPFTHILQMLIESGLKGQLWQGWGGASIGCQSMKGVCGEELGSDFKMAHGSELPHSTHQLSRHSLSPPPSPHTAAFQHLWIKEWAADNTIAVAPMKMYRYYREEKSKGGGGSTKQVLLGWGGWMLQPIPGQLAATITVELHSAHPCSRSGSTPRWITSKPGFKRRAKE